MDPKQLFHKRASGPNHKTGWTLRQLLYWIWATMRGLLAYSWQFILTCLENYFRRLILFITYFSLFASRVINHFEKITYTLSKKIKKLRFFQVFYPSICMSFLCNYHADILSLSRHESNIRYFVLHSVSFLITFYLSPKLSLNILYC